MPAVRESTRRLDRRYTKNQMPNQAYYVKIETKSLIEYAAYVANREFDSDTKLLKHLHFLQTGGRWVFRGQKDINWKLEPTFQRRTRKLEEAPTRIGSIVETEKYVIEQFRRRAHQYNPYLGHLSSLEWLALMQHHGAPTRLLDWTRSAWVGAFFAAADADPQEDSAIWVIDARWLKEKAVTLIRDRRPELKDISEDTDLGAPDSFDRMFFASSHELDSVIAPVEPFTMDERLTAQQGFFLCSTTLSWPFEMTLKHMLEAQPEEQLVIQRLVIKPEARLGLLRQLHGMNINYGTLFPGLDGFARSLSNVAELHASSHAADPSDLL